MESKKINQLATELTPALSDLTIIGDPSTGISKKITLSQMASLFTGTVEEYANLAAFPLVGVADTIYIALDTNVLYRWNTGTNAYVELSPNIINSLVFSDANGFDGTISLVGSVATLTITTALTTGSVAFIGASGALLQDNANFFWDDTNNRLGIGTNAPTTAIDAFGSGIIGRLNGTSTNNSFLGFASAGTNKWSIGNVQSDHRFRIFSEANTAELVSVLQTGEFGIGIANPTTKLHIDGGASALIANLDANVSVAKSISFRSDNSNRINLEVSGTESGSNAGANFFLRAYSDAGALLNTPLTITRSTGAATFANSVSGTQFNATSKYTFGTATDGTTGQIATDNTNNFFDYLGTLFIRNAISSANRLILTSNGNLTIGSTEGTGAGSLFAGAATFSGNIVQSATNAIINSGTATGSGYFGNLSGGAYINTFGASHATKPNYTEIAGANGIYLLNAATFSSTIATSGDITITKASSASFIANNTSASGKSYRLFSADDGTFRIQNTGVLDLVTITSTGVTSFANTVRAVGTLFLQRSSGGANTILQFTNEAGANRSKIVFGGTNEELGFFSGDGTSETMRIASNGLVSINETYSSANYKFAVKGASHLTGSNNKGLFITDSASFASIVGLNKEISAYNPIELRASGTDYQLYLNTSGNIGIGSVGGSSTRLSIQAATANTAVRIDADSGQSAILIGGNGNINVDYPGVSNGRFQLDGNGNVYNRTGVYGTISSDIRLKENIVDASSKLDDILKLRVVNFNLISDLEKKKNIGFIAQELKQIFPSFVYETDTRQYDEEGNLISGLQDSLGVKVGMEFAVLTKAIQELNDKIESLR